MYVYASTVHNTKKETHLPTHQQWILCTEAPPLTNDAGRDHRLQSLLTLRTLRLVETVHNSPTAVNVYASTVNALFKTE